MSFSRVLAALHHSREDDLARERAEAAAARYRVADAESRPGVGVNGPDRSRFVWITDVLPDELSDRIAQLMDAGLTAMKATLERA